MSTFDQAGNAPVPAVKKATAAAEGSPALKPTAITIPAALTSVAGDLDRCIETLTSVIPNGIAHLGEADREFLINTAVALKHIAEESSGALGVLARSGIKPLEEAAG